MQAARIVTHPLAVLAFYRHQILFLVRTLNGGIFSGPNAVRLAAPRKTHNVAYFVLRGPLSVRARDLLPCNEHTLFVFVRIDLTSRLHFPVDTLIDFSARSIVRGDYQRAFGFRCVLACDFL